MYTLCDDGVLYLLQFMHALFFVIVNLILNGGLETFATD